MESFGEIIKKIRVGKGLLLREVAAGMNIDPSVLSRIEGNHKRASRDHVVQLAVVLQTSEEDLMISYLSDKICYELEGEELAMEVMSVAEKKIRYFTSHRKPLKPYTKNENH